MKIRGGTGRSRLEKITRLLIAGITLAVVLYVALRESEESTSPGPLHPSHASIPKLQSAEACTQCHGEGGAPMDMACLACHEEIKAQQDGAIGIHGKLDASKHLFCKDCHTEHTGGAVGLVAKRSFDLIETSGTADFDHARFAPFTLTGKHQNLECVKCHANALLPAMNEGQLRFLGLSQACTGCHKDPHEGTLGADCASCHGQEKPFKEAPGFQHDAAFPLTGGHAGLECASCHAQEGTTSVASLLATKDAPIRKCADCHRSPHSAAFVTRVAALAGTPENETCAACHDAAHETFLGPKATLTSAQHAATGFALDAPHAGLDCVQCHEQYGKRERLSGGDDVGAQFAALFPGRVLEECARCHEDPHKGQFSGRFTCIECHEKAKWTPSKFDAGMHAATKFPLTGGHRTAACDRCHDPARGVERFTGVAIECAACHKDVHQGQFDQAGRPKETGGRTGCARCHDTENFKAVRWTSGDHLAWTGYALDGAHAKAGCAQCHPQAATYAKTYGGARRECEACHEDAHRGAFDAAAQKEVAGRTGCARCHDNTEFASVTWNNNDHTAWTGYAIEGVHLKLKCTQCHKPSNDTGVKGRTFGFARRDCVSCHADPHAGQFDVQGRTDCLRCHTLQENFRAHKFDHKKDSRFVLDETHARLDCGVCHQPFKTDSGRMAIRYKPLGFQCQDCHNFPSATGAREQ